MEDDPTGPYGLPIPSSAANYHDDGATPPRPRPLVVGESGTTPPAVVRHVGKLAYFTNANRPIDDVDSSSPCVGKAIAIVCVHGSGRDAKSTLRRLADAVTTTNTTTTTTTTTTGEDVVDDDAEDGDVSTITKPTTENGGCGEDNVLIVAPWFLAPVDICPPPPESASSSSTSPPYLRWVDDPHGPLGIEHSFRYGAESIYNGPPVIEEKDDVGDDNYEHDAAEMSENTISSYAAMDVLIETLCDRTHYPDLERIVVVGHSAGGQLVHRWGLTSGSWCFGDDYDDDIDIDARRPLPSISIVSANPRSYTYLDGRRYLSVISSDVDENDAMSSSTDVGGGGRAEILPSSPFSFDDLAFRYPTECEAEECRYYNRYMWGLEDNPDLPTPYVRRNVDRLMTRDLGLRDDGNENHDADALFCRYAMRNVTYLSGENDTKTLEDQISNGDGYQGPTRRERCERYYASLQVRGNDILRDRRRGGITDEEGHGTDRINKTSSRAKKKFHSSHAEGREMRVHRLIMVKDVGHNGALMFQSNECRIAMIC